MAVMIREVNTKTLDTALKLNDIGLNLIAVYGIKEDGSCTCFVGNECPMKNRGKHPIGHNWPSRLLTTHREIEAASEKYPGCNFGIPGGSANTCGDMKLLLLDFDGPVGLEVLKRYEDEGLIPRTMKFRTGSGGAHVPLWVRKDFVISNTSGSIEKGLDIKYERGSVVAPGSRNASGTYDFMKGFGPEDVAIYPAPEKLLAKLEAHEAKRDNARVELSERAEVLVEPMGVYNASLELRMEHARTEIKSLFQSGIDPSDRDSAIMKEMYRDHLKSGLYTLQEIVDVIWKHRLEKGERHHKIRYYRKSLDKMMGKVDAEEAQNASIKRTFENTLCISSLSDFTTGPDMLQVVKKPLPYEVLRPILGDTIDSICEYTDMGPEYVLGHVLAALGSAPGLGLRGRIREGMHVRTNIYHLLLAPTGVNKSAPMTRAIEPLNEIHKLKQEHHKNEMVTYRKEKAKYDRAMRKDSAEVSLTLPTRPVMSQVRFESFTLESLVKALSENPHGGIIAADEFISVLNSFGQYKGGAGGDRQFLLNAFDNGSYASLRVKDEEPVYIPELFLGITGTMQPVLFDKFRINCTHSDGWWDRFLITSTEEMSVVPLEQIPPNINLNSYHTLIKCLLRYRNNSQPEILNFDPDAFSMYSAWHLQNQKEYKAKGFNPFLRSFWSKSNTILAKLAVLFQACENINNGKEVSVTQENVNRGIVIIEAFRNQRLHLFQQLTVSEDDERIKTAIEWLKNIGGQASYRDCYRDRIVGCVRSKDAKELFELLCDTGKCKMDIIKADNNRPVSIIKLL